MKQTFWPLMAMLSTAAVLFPLCLLWLGLGVWQALLLALLYGVGSLLSVWGVLREAKAPKAPGSFGQWPRWARVVMYCVVAVLLLVLFVADVRETGVPPGMVRAAAFVMAVLAAAATYKLMEK